jgi:hypothetical protein
MQARACGAPAVCRRLAVAGAPPAKCGWPANVSALLAYFCRPAALQWPEAVKKRC